MTDNSAALDYDEFNAKDLIPHDHYQKDSQHSPNSVNDFMDRLSSFDLLFWTRKPDILSSFHCSRFGWKLYNKNVLICVSCKKILPVSNSSNFGYPGMVSIILRILMYFI